MTAIKYELKPYPGRPFPEGLLVSGNICREGAILKLDWRLEGASETLSIPLPEARPERRRELWEETCCEFFLASSNKAGYWEFNLSPSGHWNVFHFDSYRAGLKDELAFEALPFSVLTQPGLCIVSVALDTTRLGIANEPWELAVSTVVRETKAPNSYWALNHPGTQPDFHHSDAFGIRLNP